MVQGRSIDDTEELVLPSSSRSRTIPAQRSASVSANRLAEGAVLAWRVGLTLSESIKDGLFLNGQQIGRSGRQ